MKTTIRLASLLLPLAALLTTAPAVFADETDPALDPATDAPFKPKEYDISRYSKNFEKKSPFEFDPPPPTVEQETNNFDGVSLGGYCGNGNTMSVYLIVGKEKKRITVYGDGSPFKKLDKSGFRIVSIKRGTSLATTAVVLEKGGQQKEVTFEKDTLLAKGGAGGAPQTQMVIGPDGRPIQRTVVPRPGGGSGAPSQPYQAPAAFIPGQSNGGGGMVPGQGNQNGQQAIQNLANFQAQQQAGMSPQQQVNQLVNTPNIPQMQNGNVVPGQTGTAGQQPPQRRRVVLPTQNP